MFGRNLADTLRVDLKRGGGFVPIILEKCVEFLRQTGNAQVTFSASSSSVFYLCCAAESRTLL